MKQGSFSRNLAIVYTLIIAIPLMVCIMTASEYLRQSLYDSIKADARQAVADNAAVVDDRVSQIERLESIIASDLDFLSVLYSTESIDDYSVLESLLLDINNLDRLQYAMPKVYSLHLFIKNKAIPERWPVILYQDRLDCARLGRWTLNYTDQSMSSVNQRSELSACLTREVFYRKRHVGYLQIGMRMTDFFPFLYDQGDRDFRDYAFSGGASLVAATDGDGYFASASRAAVEADRLPLDNPDAPDDDLSGVREVRGPSGDLIVAWRRVPRQGLLLVRVASTAAITQSIAMIRFSSIAILILSILVLFAIIFFTTRRMFARLYLVMDGMRRLRSGNLNVSVAVAGNDEVAEMADTFTSMAVRLAGLVDEIKREQELVAQTEVKAMQNQINAHFLYNALETIQMQAELRDEREIAESVTLLGRMMRYCLRWRNHRVSLAEEIDYVRDYVAFMNIRNDYRIDLALDVPEDALESEVPKMLIQPIVENAVLHAIEPRGEDATVSIAAARDEAARTLTISVSDSGLGMDADSLASLRQKLDGPHDASDRVGGIGLKNIQDRLRAFYGPDFSLIIESSPGTGTTVRVPVRLEDGACSPS